MKITMDDRQFMREMKNILGYAEGFLVGAKSAESKLLKNLGLSVKEMLEEYLDAMARMDPEQLHHVYEWYQTGSPDARLFDIDYKVSGTGLSISSTFSQSRSIKAGSKVPFYDKAAMMEAGVSVTIKPREASVLAFTDNGEQVFTSRPVTVNNPGGRSVEGSFKNAFDNFFKQYLSQSMLDISGISKDLKNPIAFKKNLAAGKTGGKAVGLRVGADWVSRAGATV